MPAAKPVLGFFEWLYSAACHLIYPFIVVNRIRTQNGMTPLELITIDLIEIIPAGATTNSAAAGAKVYSPEAPNEAKLSSTLLRSFITNE